MGTNTKISFDMISTYSFNFFIRMFEAPLNFILQTTSTELWL